MSSSFFEFDALSDRPNSLQVISQLSSTRHCGNVIASWAIAMGAQLLESTPQRPLNLPANGYFS